MVGKDVLAGQTALTSTAFFGQARSETLRKHSVFEQARPAAQQRRRAPQSATERYRATRFDKSGRRAEVKGLFIPQTVLALRGSYLFYPIWECSAHFSKFAAPSPPVAARRRWQVAHHKLHIDCTPKIAPHRLHSIDCTPEIAPHRLDGID